MSNHYLSIRFQDDNDGTGKLIARAESRGFAGAAGAYFNITQVEEFAVAISAFPLPQQDQRRSIEGGFGKKERPGELEEHLGLTVYPIDVKRGYVGIQIRMATELWEGSRPQSQHQAKIEIVTTYEPLARFSADILKLVRGDTEEAVLLGEQTTPSSS